MFNRVKISNVYLFATKTENGNIYKIYKISFCSGLCFYYLTKNDKFMFDFINDFQLEDYININGFIYENK